MDKNSIFQHLTIDLLVWPLTHIAFVLMCVCVSPVPRVLAKLASRLHALLLTVMQNKICVAIFCFGLGLRLVGHVCSSVCVLTFGFGKKLLILDHNSHLPVCVCVCVCFGLGLGWLLLTPILYSNQCVYCFGLWPRLVITDVPKICANVFWPNRASVGYYGIDINSALPCPCPCPPPQWCVCVCAVPEAGSSRIIFKIRMNLRYGIQHKTCRPCVVCCKIHRCAISMESSFCPEL